MKTKVLFALMLMLAGCQAISPLPLPEAMVADVAHARDVGSLTYRHLRATKLARSIVPEALSLEALTEQVDGRGTVRVSFVATDPDRIVKSVLVPDRKVGEKVELESSRARSLNEFESNKLSGLRLLRAQAVEPCGDGDDAALIAWGRGGTFYGYRVPRVDARHIAVGGVREFVINKTGTEILSARPAAHPCRVEARAARVTLSESGLSVPTPTDVLIALQTSARLSLNTLRGGRWLLEDEYVTLLEAPHPAPAQPIDPPRPLDH